MRTCRSSPTNSWASFALLGSGSEGAATSADAVAHGTSFIITSHGKPVARLGPPPAKANEAANQRLLDRLRSQPVQDIGPWTRDELYD
jgi:antitoxin (DNA-binding transcriptional repressor) of toxin-antitoxin stability system